MIKAKRGLRLFISPGGNGTPDTPKLKCLESVAEKKKIDYILPDWRDVACDPQVRLELLIEEGVLESERVVLAGSSLGGYVSVIAAERQEVDGLFLLVPILGPKNSENYFPKPNSKETVIIHASDDEYTEAKRVVEFARTLDADLHVLDGGHSLDSHLKFIEQEFESFLDRIIE